MNFDFDFYRENLNATKPPYKCPIKSCDKLYRSLPGIKQHLNEHEMEGNKLNRPFTKNGKRNKNAKSKYKGEAGLKSGNFNNQLLEVELGGETVTLDAKMPMQIIKIDSKFETKVPNLKMISSRKDRNDDFEDSHYQHDADEHSHGATNLPEAKFKILDDYAKRSDCASSENRKEFKSMYDLDEQDKAWLSIINKERMKKHLPQLTPNLLEYAIDLFEQQCYFKQISSAPHSPSQHLNSTKDEDAVCCICNDGECISTNVILFCDLCNIAVHQECYGVPHIPDGLWVCRRCLISPSNSVPCCLCPSKVGAMKQTDDGRWAHIICALWIPDAGFANLVFLEPIDGIDRISKARWKLTCQICKRKSSGACIQCHKSSCYNAFHVTCAQKANYYMKIEPIASHTASLSSPPPSSFSYKKTAYCDMHTPKSHQSDKSCKSVLDRNVSVLSTSGPMKSRIRKARKMVMEGREELPILSFPSITDKW
ncbi:hypothetical protein HELRODRAFT_71717 [Helobdella robusta]|uniref:PHD-type domain-containing protein n=1 Tax=Helobdella robusta TaxID=6412 RepID=T1G0Q4_HELRO|nr:hypothetical protein HELRODRAFT_71717 [Helobdella robusta]ESO11512.1 hypothetical protein HELRODRAFT_71717 [Helobdella robusta]